VNDEHGGLLESAFEASPVPALIVDTAMRVVAANAAYTRMSGRTWAQLDGAFTIEFIHADDMAGALDGYDRLRAGATSVMQRRRLRRGDGTWAEALTLTTLFRHDSAEYVLVQYPEYQTSVDVDTVAELETRSILGAFGDAVCFHDARGRIVVTPKYFADRLGRSIGWLHGRALTDPALEPVTTDGTPIGPAHDPVAEALRTGTEVIRTIGLKARDGSVVWYSVRCAPVDQRAVVARSTLREVTELIETQHEIRAMAAIVERELAHQIDHDDLTGLRTRKSLIALTDAALESGEQVAVVFVDLNQFKEINDDLGHLAGDDVLLAVVDQLIELTPAGAVLGRAGGDEFVLLARSVAAAEDFARAVHERSISSDGLAAVHGRRVGASVGVAESLPGDTRSALFARADKAMYRTKRLSRATRVAQRSG
jgi:diguanylate cyclase (GGDEF)-like protein/PAS domain S-box-containing protein